MCSPAIIEQVKKRISRRNALAALGGAGPPLRRVACPPPFRPETSPVSKSAHPAPKKTVFQTRRGLLFPGG